MPEGISWASFILQEEMTKIFRDLGFVFNIADNLCIGADSLDQLYQRVELFLERCAKHNVLLKWSKSDIGFRQTHFFGYDIEYNKFSLGDDRRQVIDNIPVPTSSKLMAKFLGIAVFFSKFVPDWARLAAPLYKTTHKDFIWTKETVNEVSNDFKIMKLACVHSLSLYFPNYDLQWIARTDASQLGVGGVLFQMYDDGVQQILQPIYFFGKMFSDPAQSWSTIKQEAYAIFYFCKKMEFYIRGKTFLLETDHRNLLWMENATDNMVKRMTWFIQQFVTVIRHISGPRNYFADFLSRTHPLSQEQATINCLFHVLWMDSVAVAAQHLFIDQSSCSPTDAVLYTLLATNHTENSVAVVNQLSSITAEKLNHTKSVSFDVDSIDDSLHVITRSQATKVTASDIDKEIYEAQQRASSSCPKGGKEVVNAELWNRQLQRWTNEGKEVLQNWTNACSKAHNNGHWGKHRTYTLLKQMYPSCNVPYKFVDDFVSTCFICQMTRILSNRKTMDPMKLSTKEIYSKRSIGVDNVTFDKDEYGNKYISVVVNLLTGLCKLYCIEEISTENTIKSILSFMCDHGLFDEIRTDPGVDYTSKLMDQFEKMFGFSHTFSLVDRHTSNAVERVIQEVIRHLRAIVTSKRMKTKWSNEMIIKHIEFLLNSLPLSERGNYSAHELTYGSKDLLYFHLLKNFKSANMSAEDWKGIVKIIRKDIDDVQQASKEAQSAIIAERAKANESHSRYAVGDFVIRKKTNPVHSNKLAPMFYGPYEVISHYKNDVTCRHLANSDLVETFPVEHLYLYFATRDEAIFMAKAEIDEYTIVKVSAYRGNIYHRTDLEFYCHFEDNDCLWKRYGTGEGDVNGSTTAITSFIKDTPIRELFHILKASGPEENAYRKQFHKQPIDVDIGDVFYLDLRYYSWEKSAADRTTWFVDLNLPHKNHKIYVTKCVFFQWRYTGNKFAVIVKDIVMDAQFVFNAYEVHHFAYRKVLNDNCILVTNEVKAEHKISMISQYSSSSCTDRMYDQFCHFMDQS